MSIPGGGGAKAVTDLLASTHEARRYDGPDTNLWYEYAPARTWLLASVYDSSSSMLLNQDVCV